MDLDEFRSILSRSRVGIWALIDTAVKVASSDHGDELRRRRDGIVQSLYATATCRRCHVELCEPVGDFFGGQSCKKGIDGSNNRDFDDYGNEEDGRNKARNDDGRIIGDSNCSNLNEALSSKSPLTPESNQANASGGEDDLDPSGGLFDDDEETTILSIKEQLEDPKQTEDSLVELLQSLADMDINFQALKVTDIGRPVNRLRKHPSNEVRTMVKQLVRKWKETVDEWVKVNQPNATSDLIGADEYSPQKSTPKIQQNSQHQVPDFGYSPDRQIGKSSAEGNRADHETKTRPPPVHKSASAPPPSGSQRELVIDDERLNSARRRLQENYQEAENAKRQRTIRVMDIHDIPKPKKAFFGKNKGGFHGRNH